MVSPASYPGCQQGRSRRPSLELPVVGSSLCGSSQCHGSTLAAEAKHGIESSSRRLRPRNSRGNEELIRDCCVTDEVDQMRRRVLLVAAELDLRARFARELQASGYAVELACDMKRALGLAAKDRF